jgi:hypothetical protein
MLEVKVMASKPKEHDRQKIVSSNDDKRPVILSDSMKALFGVDDKCYSPIPSFCDAAMVGRDAKQGIRVVCVTPDVPCKWRDRYKPKKDATGLKTQDDGT